jgi:hypothetical protein
MKMKAVHEAAVSNPAGMLMLNVADTLASPEPHEIHMVPPGLRLHSVYAVRHGVTSGGRYSLDIR